MSKRRPDTDLNHDNWNDEEEPEDVGNFKKASVDVLKNRTILTGRRRGSAAINSSDSQSATKSIFSSFSGFTKSNNDGVVKPSASLFSFLSSENTNNDKDKNDVVSKPITITAMPTPPSPKPQIKTFLSNTTKLSNNETKSSIYYQHLKGLNQGVSEWIQKHVSLNPLCILTPIFDDYKKFLNQIEDEESKTNVKNNNSTSSKSVIDTDSIGMQVSSNKNNDSGKKLKTSTTSITLTETKSQSENKFPGFTFKNTTNEDNNPLLNLPSSTNLFSPTSKVALPFSSASKGGSPFPSQSSTTTPFSFGSSLSSSSSGFSFNPGSKPFTFANVEKSKDSQDGSTGGDGQKDEDQDEDQPPKVTFVPVVEKDSIYSKKCKIFAKSGNDFTDRGVGTLYMKKVEGSDKIQLIVRADTNLGNILLNILLTDAIPVQRLGKNNIMMICVPTPESKPPPTTILIRVKTEDEANEVFTKIKEHKRN